MSITKGEFRGGLASEFWRRSIFRDDACFGMVEGNVVLISFHTFCTLTHSGFRLRTSQKACYISQSLEGGFTGRALYKVEEEAGVGGSEGSLELRYTTSLLKTFSSLKEFSSFNIEILLGD